MSFWNLSTDETIDSQTAGTFEVGGGEPIPANTQLKACIDDACWDEYEGDSFIKITWSVLDGEHANRKVFQKVRVNECDNKKRDKAIRMLAAIDANAGGTLMKLQGEPTDNDLQSALVNKPMVIKVGVWEINDSKGNWVQKVAPLSSLVVEDDFDDDIGF